MEKKMYNALESGVIADGVTDVSAAFQNAINTAIIFSKAGGKRKNTENFHPCLKVFCRMEGVL